MHCGKTWISSLMGIPLWLSLGIPWGKHVFTIYFILLSIWRMCKISGTLKVRIFMFYKYFHDFHSRCGTQSSIHTIHVSVGLVLNFKGYPLKKVDHWEPRMDFLNLALPLPTPASYMNLILTHFVTKVTILGNLEEGITLLAKTGLLTIQKSCKE